MPIFDMTPHQNTCVYVHTHRSRYVQRNEHMKTETKRAYIRIGTTASKKRISVCVFNWVPPGIEHMKMTIEQMKICSLSRTGGGLGSRPKKMYGERLGDEVEYHLMKPTPRR